MRRKIAAVIKDLKRCVFENEKDAKQSAGFCPRDCAQAMAVAAEQRRMIKILQRIAGVTHE